MDIVNRNEVRPFITKDGSLIREVLSPRNSSIRRQSLAEARVKPGKSTEPHTHPGTEEIYYLLEGHGVISIDGVKEKVKAGDGIAIPPGAKHAIFNNGESDLVFLCCCVPAYQDSDTVITDDVP